MTQHIFYEQVVNRTGLLHQAALRLTGNNDLAQDLVQDTILLALEHWQKFVEGSRLEAWLYIIMRNNFINHYRRKQKRKQAVSYLEKSGWPPQGVQNTCGFSRVITKTIYQQLEALPGEYSRLLKLRLAGYRYEEIAQQTGKSLGTVKSRIHLARKLLKEKLVQTACSFD